MKQYWVYIMASLTRVLYIGVTNSLPRRVYEHKHHVASSFTSRYNVTRLVYYEPWSDVGEAILREKQLKGWLRAKKVSLIEATNPRWEDLSGDLAR